MTESEAPAVQSAPAESRTMKDRVTISLPCTLSRTDHIERCRSLANLLIKVDAVEDEHAALKLTMKEERESLEAEIRSIRRVVASGEEMRDVECIDFYDYATGQVDRVRTDTTETISTRVMSAEERQASLTLVP